MPITVSNAIPGNTWQPLIWDVPRKDQAVTYMDKGVFPGVTAAYAVAQSPYDGTIWNGTAMVQPAAPDWPNYAIPAAAQAGASRIFRVDVPFATMPEGQYYIRMYSWSGSAASRNDRVLQQTLEASFTNSRPNPDGIPVDCDYGGGNAMRLTDAHGRGLKGVQVRAMVAFPEANVERARAESDHEGRWKFAYPLEPGRLHVINFTLPGFNFSLVRITPGSNA